MNNLVKKDYWLGAAVGFLAGLFAIPVLLNIKIAGGILLPTAGPIILAVLFAFGVWLGGFLSRWLAFFAQFGKFAAVGFLNAAIDFGVLNSLIFMSGINVGIMFSLFKAVSFIVAGTNSYLWNKFWTFKSGQGFVAGREYASFLVVSLVGLGINVAVASFVVNFVGPQFGIEATLWANVGAVFGAALGLFWNFVGYKFIVFSPKRGLT